MVKHIAVTCLLLVHFTIVAQKKKTVKKPVKHSTTTQVKKPTPTGMKNAKILDSLLNTTAILKQVKDNRSQYRLQIIYTQITRQADGSPTFKDYTFNVDSNLYFYCASMVKLPISILALEKVNSQKALRISRQTAMLTDSLRFCQTKMLKDTTSPTGFPTIEHHIRKMLLVSDNVSFSRTLEYVTPDYAHTRMKALGFPLARLGGRFDVACIGPGNQWMNQIRFIENNGTLLYTQKGDSVQIQLPQPIPNMKVGRNVYRKKKLIATPKDFSKSNFMPLTTIHRVLRNLVFMDFVPENMRYTITKEDQVFLLTQMTKYPRESKRPLYDSAQYHDTYKKYLVHGAKTKHVAEDTLRIINIVGRAYGFISDCAYVVNTKDGTEFMVSVVLYTNKRNTFGTGNYEYDTIGLPFLRDLGVALYRYEKQRQRTFKTDLSIFSQYATEL